LKRNKPAVFAAVLVTVLMDETERDAALMLERPKTSVRDDKLLGLRLIEECLRARGME